jgi:hypothetical protein
VSKKNLLLYVFTLLAISIASFFPFYLQGIREDCRPNQIDGQCGLSTFLGEMYGAAASVAVLVVGGTVLAIVHNRIQKKAEERYTDIGDNARK